jgi:hypothetical protein
VDQWYIEGKEQLEQEIESILDDPPTWEEPMTTLMTEDFESPFFQYGGDPQLKVPLDAIPWYRQDPDNPSSKRPEFTQNKDHFFTGSACQKIFMVFAVWNGGLIWHVEVPTNVSITASIYGMMLTGSNDNEQLGDGWWRIGLAPGEHMEPPADTVWSEKIDGIYDQWNELDVSMNSGENTVISVFTESDWKWAVGWNDLYLDDLFVDADTDPTPPPAGNYTVVILDGQGNEVLREPFPVSGGIDVNRVNEIGRELISMTS